MTRKEAITAGLRFYDNNKPCIRGHLPAIRYAITGKCVTCAKTEGERYREQRRVHAIKNSATIVARVTAWKAQNPDKLAENTAKYREKHREQLRIRSVLYRQANPTDPMLRRVREARRRTRKMTNGGSYTKEDVTDLMRNQKGRCSYCRKDITRQFAVDHIIPLRLGGSSNRSNLQLLCRSCNSSKGGKHPTDFAHSRGLLI